MIQLVMKKFWILLSVNFVQVLYLAVQLLNVEIWNVIQFFITIASGLFQKRRENLSVQNVRPIFDFIKIK